MTFPYLAIIAKSDEGMVRLSEAVQLKSQMTPVLNTRRAMVFSRPGMVLPLPSEWGVVLGPVFTREAIPSRVVAVEGAAANRIMLSMGQELIDCYWGSYVALLPDESKGQVSVLRDPSGQMPCYYYEIDEGTVVTSDLETLWASGLFVPDIDYDYISSFLYARDLRTERTGFKRLKELLPGWRLTLDHEGGRVSSCWSPWDYTVPHTPAVERADRLREVMAGSVGAWASCYSRIGLGISGGLDSSVLAASLTDQGISWSGMTIATCEAEGDERRYARIVSNSLNAPLIEVFHSAEFVDLTKPNAPYQPRPSGNFLGQSYSALLRSIQNSHQLDAYFTGIGGDSLFCYMQSATPLLDRLYSEGIGSGTWQTLNNVCRLSGASYSEVLAMAVKRALSGGPTYKWRGSPGLLKLQNGEPELSHPWLTAPRGVLPGKAVHVVMLLRIQGTQGVSPMYDQMPYVAPLYTQPMMEFCLGIPSWCWCEDGENRSLVRRAFSKSLPNEIIRRRTKGGPDSFMIDIIQAQKPLIRNLLLGGSLAQNDYIDRTALDKVLRDDAVVDAPEHIQIEGLLEAENWLNFWLERVGGARKCVVA